MAVLRLILLREGGVLGAANKCNREIRKHKFKIEWMKVASIEKRGCNGSTVYSSVQVKPKFILSTYFHAYCGIEASDNENNKKLRFNKT